MLYTAIKKATLSFAILALLFSCKPKIDKNAAEKQLRAFDNEIIVAAKNIGQTITFQVLKQLFDFKGLPLPFQYNAAELGVGEPYKFNFETLKGNYSICAQTKTVSKISVSDSIVIEMPYNGKGSSKSKIILCEYAEELTVWNIYMPTKLIALVETDGKVNCKIELNGTIYKGIPTKIYIDAHFEDHDVLVSMNTKLSKKTSKAKIVALLSKGGNQLLKNEMKLEIAMDKSNEVAFKNIYSELEVFPIVAQINVNQSGIDKHTTNFVRDFNQNSNIKLFGNNGKTELGRVSLANRDHNNRLNIVVTYNNGESAYIDELLFSATKILNVKL